MVKNQHLQRKFSSLATRNCRGTSVGKAPTLDNLLVFYFSDPQVWTAYCEKMLGAGFEPVKSYNPYWDRLGKTFEDVDGYRVVLQNREWSA